jgi:hypothetical protein
MNVEDLKVGDSFIACLICNNITLSYYAMPGALIDYNDSKCNVCNGVHPIPWSELQS